MRRKAAHFPGRYDVDRLAGVWTVRSFDEAFTAPHFGFASAADYYHRASALRVIDRIRVPALIVTAMDDPFVPPGPFRDPAVTSNPNVHVVLTPHGGHCGFITDPLRDTTGIGRNADRADGSGGMRVVALPRLPPRRSYAPRRQRGQLRHEVRRERRPEPLLFVLEIDECLRAPASPAITAAQRSMSAGWYPSSRKPEVGVVGGHLHRRAELLAVGDAQREVARAQDSNTSASNQDA